MREKCGGSRRTKEASRIRGEMSTQGSEWEHSREGEFSLSPIGRPLKAQMSLTMLMLFFFFALLCVDGIVVVLVSLVRYSLPLPFGLFFPWQVECDQLSGTLQWDKSGFHSLIAAASIPAADATPVPDHYLPVQQGQYLFYCLLVFFLQTASCMFQPALITETIC